MDQTIINWIVAAFGALIGFFLNVVWGALKDLQIADKDLTEKVASIEVLVAGDYVRKDDVQEISKAIFAKLDRIEDKLDHKMDKK